MANMHIIRSNMVAKCERSRATKNSIFCTRIRKHQKLVKAFIYLRESCHKHLCASRAVCGFSCRPSCLVSLYANVVLDKSFQLFYSNHIFVLITLTTIHTTKGDVHNIFFRFFLWNESMAQRLQIFIM